MKKFTQSALALLIALSGAASAEEVIIGTNNVHVPKGFDANDPQVEVILTGELPNTCYRRPFGEAKVVGDKIVIDTKATRVSDPQIMCIMAVVPYMITVPLGSLEQGNYHIDVNPNTADAKTSSIEVDQPGSEGIDNFNYANVTSVKRLPGTKTLALEGAHPSSCMSFESIRVIANDTNDTFAILPIIKQVGEICDRSIKPFVEYVNLPEVGEKEIVVHVRILDGNAINVRIPKQGSK